MHLASKRKRDLVKIILVWGHCWTYETAACECPEDQSAKEELHKHIPHPAEGLKKTSEEPLIFSNSALSGILIFEA
jgi:hypothetical protein